MRVATAHDTKARLVALKAGILAAGDELVQAGELADVAIASNWGAALHLQRMGYRVAVCECGWLGNRNWWCSLSLDGLNGRGIHVEAPVRPEPELEPWRARESGYALLLGQIPHDWAVKCALEGMTYEQWLLETTRVLERAYGFQVRYRMHPEVYMLQPHEPEPPRARLMRTRARVPKPGQPSLRAELEGAQIAVTLNSTAAVDAIVMGVPTVVWDRHGCMAAPVSARFGPRLLEEPGRRSWVNRLARLQWSMEELRSGLAWRALREVL